MPEYANANVPAAAGDIEALLRQELEQDAAGFRVVPVRVGVEHRLKVFSYPDGTTKPELRGVILKSQIARGYWRRGDRKPVCTSRDGITGTDAGGNEHECARCGRNRWGTAVKLNEMGQPVQGKGKACKEMRRLLFLEDGADLPVLLNVPPSSLQAFDAFCTLLRTRQQPLIATHVSIRLNEAEADGMRFARMQFAADRRVEPSDIPRLVALREAVLQSVDIGEVSEADLEEPSTERNVTPPAGGEDPFGIDLGSIQF